MTTTPQSPTPAASGVELPELPSPRAFHYNMAHNPLYTAAQMRAYARQALAAQPAPGVGGDNRYAEQHARDSKELRKLCESRDFYRRRCDSLQGLQSNMRDPERKAVCDILANGTTTALTTRPAESVARGGDAVELDCYDAGLLNDFGGGNVEWWQDYIRAELARAHDFYQSQLATPTPATGSGGEAYPIGWVMVDDDHRVVDFTNRMPIANGWRDDPRKIVHPVYAHPAPAGGDAGDSK